MYRVYYIFVGFLAGYAAAVMLGGGGGPGRPPPGPGGQGLTPPNRGKASGSVLPPFRHAPCQVNIYAVAGFGFRSDDQSYDQFLTRFTETEEQGHFQAVAEGPE